MKAFRFIPPCLPATGAALPSGPHWVHEIKFDGWRSQLHKSGKEVRIFSKRGFDLTGRFPLIAEELASLPQDQLILDAEIVAEDETGRPNFDALLARRSQAHIVVWIFDLLAINGLDICSATLEQRRAMLASSFGELPSHFRYSESFDDPVSLLRVATKFKLEGIVSKRLSSPYRSGHTRDWLKIKTEEWREANRQRWELFSKPQAEKR